MIFFWSETRHNFPITADLLWFTKTSGKALIHTDTHHAPETLRSAPNTYQYDEKMIPAWIAHILDHVGTQPHSQSSLALFLESVASTAAWTQSTAKHCFY